MDDKERDLKAAQVLQKYWRQRQGAPKTQVDPQGADARWKDAVIEAKAKVRHGLSTRYTRSLVTRQTCNQRRGVGRCVIAHVLALAYQGFDRGE